MCATKMCNNMKLSPKEGEGVGGRLSSIPYPMWLTIRRNVVSAMVNLSVRS